MTNPAPTFTKVILETGPDGRSRFRDEVVPLAENKPLLFLTERMSGGNVQIRVSPRGYSMDFHCTTSPQWTFVLSGTLEIGLVDGSARQFRAGDHLFAVDTLAPGATFDPKVHGHNSRQVGDEAVVTALVRG
ncbi:MAG TPA: hypothetical protein VLJ86_04660 [Ramlibacter sp.]|nr:hypothetical protein [Ramlibacter sp.]